jgi:transposase
MDNVSDSAKGVYRRIEVLTGPGRRRKWSDDDKPRIVAEAAQPGVVVSEIAHRWQVTPQQVFDWRRQARKALAVAMTSAEPAFVPIIPMGHIAMPDPAGPACRPASPIGHSLIPPSAEPRTPFLQAPCLPDHYRPRGAADPA